MLGRMRRWLARMRRIVVSASVALLAAQVATMLGLTAFESYRAKHRKLRRFPFTPATSVTVGPDEVTVYTYGEELYADMLAAIEDATRTIYFETYIWKADQVGEEFKQALDRAAQRGVDVYVIWDDFANLVVPRKFFTTMPEAIHVMRHPALPVPWRPRSWGRDHRKLLVVDGQVGFVGGYNIGSLYATGWRDTHARIRGAGTAELENAFVDFWNLHAVRGTHDQLPSPPKRRWFTDLRIHRNTPRIAVYPIRNMYLEAIDMASERVWLTHAYFLPDRDMVSALQDATKRGVDVRIILPAKSNHVVVDWLSRGFYEELLSAGVRLFGYRNAMVHAKTAVIDGTWSTIGTANLDRLSLAGNYEVNLEIVDEDVGELMEQIFTRDLTNTFEFTEERWARRSLTTKATEKLLSPWRPMF